MSTEYIFKSKNEYLEKIIDYLIEHDSCTIGDIQGHLGKGERTAYDVVKDLKDAGIIPEKQKAPYRLTDKDNLIRPDSEKFKGCEMSNKDIVEEWLILFLLSNSNKESLKENEDFYKDKIFPFYKDAPKDTAFYHKKIESLKNKGYISKRKRDTQEGLNNEKEISVTTAAPIPILIYDKDIHDPLFVDNYVENKDTVSFYKSISEMLEKIIPGYSAEALPHHITSGRYNKISEDLIKEYEDFRNINFKEHEIEITYRKKPDKSTPKTELIRVGLLAYSMEKNTIFVFCKCKKNKRKIIRLDSIDFNSIKETTKKNEEYLSEEFLNIFNKMYDISDKDPKPVKILFKNETYVKEKFEDLRASREESNIYNKENYSDYPETLTEPQKKLLDKGDWALYTDNIPEPNDFLPFVRSFGCDAIVIEPEDMRKTIMEKTEKIKENYKKELSNG